MNNSFLSVFFKLLAPKFGWYISLFILIIFIGFIPSIDSYLIKNILDFVELSGDNPSGQEFLSQMLKWALFYAMWWELINWAWRLYDYLYLKAMPDTKGYVINYYYSHVQNHSHKFFQENLAGFITNRIVEASRSLEMIFAATNEKIFRKFFTLTGAIFTLYYVKPVFATVFVIWLAIFLGLNGIFARKVKTLSTNWARNRSLIAGKIVDSISNISSIRMYNNQAYEENYISKFVNNMIASELTLNWFMLKLRYFQGLSSSIMIFGMLYYLGILRASGDITIGDFALVITLCISVADDIWDFTQEIGDLFEDVGSFGQSLDLLEEHELVDGQSSSSLKINSGKIEFCDVTFKYRRNNNIFENKNVTITSKQKVGLVGYSGSGKTTFINLISRLFDIESGKILIDGQDISKVSQKSLRDAICIIPQEPILFNRSILENIRYGKQNASDDEVIEAAKKAFVHDDIENLEAKYNSLCGEKGSKLSGGQRQRIAIARAILKNAPILILDEATSALDSITEKLIQTSMQNLMQDKTVLVIAHRLSTLENMDRILVFDKGNIVEDGTHDQLYKNKKLYRKLWDSQVGGFIVENPDNE